MGIYRDKLIQEIDLRGLSPSTKRDYLKSVMDLVKFYNKCPTQIDLEDIKNYLHHFREKLPFSLYMQPGNRK